MNFKNILSNIFLYHPQTKYHFSLSEQENNEVEILDEKKNSQSIYPSIKVNLEYIKVQYNTLINSDITIREFTLVARDRQYSAFLLYIDGMVDSKTINDFILEPLMLRNKANTYDNKNKDQIISSAVTNNITVRKVKKFNLEDYIFNCLVPQNSIRKIQKFDEIISDINSGNCAIFIDTLPIVFSAEVKGFKQRSINSPNNEIVIRGSQEAFVEAIRTNTSMLRRIINNEHLIIENTSIGKISKTKVAICYMDNIVNNDLVAEVKYRINNLDVDSLISSGQLEQLIQDDRKQYFSPNAFNRTT